MSDRSPAPAQNGYDLAVAYRVYPGVSKTPLRHADDKLRLVETCLASFCRATQGLRVRMWAILDGCPPAYEALFRTYFPGDSLTVLRLGGEGNLATFGHQIRLLRDQRAAEWVYFAEDDFFYLPGALTRMLEFARAHPDADFVTAYDHADYYTRPAHAHRHLVRSHAGRHWRTANSTVLTFLTTRRTLERTADVFESYCRGSHDFTLWLTLTGEARSPGLLLRLLRDDPVMFRLALKSWLRAPLRTAVGRRHRLWAPVPALATHLERTTLAPAVDWARHLDEAELSAPERVA